jgi:hypothetical protein
MLDAVLVLQQLALCQKEMAAAGTLSNVSPFDEQLQGLMNARTLSY